jgi:hypothetical protein
VARQYWLNLFTVITWEEFLKAGGAVTGFRESRWPRVQKLRQGDYLLCYLTGASRFVGVLEVTGEASLSREPPIWSDDFPARVAVKIILQLTPETAVPIMEVLPQLSHFDPERPHAWTGQYRGSPTLWKPSDGERIVEAIRQATVHPIDRPLTNAARNRRPRSMRPAEDRNLPSDALGSVSIPENDDAAPVPNDGTHRGIEPTEGRKEERAHTEIQWLLLKLGNDMGLDVWVARNDRNREYDGHRFSELRNLRPELPKQFDGATQTTIELIDVLWLSNKSIVAAFEIESTTSIYSGLLRMADLIAMQPNINIPLYLVAPDERREKVKAEITRPTFSTLSPPLKQVCRYLSFSTLRSEVAPQAGWVVRNLNPGFIAYLAESFDE